MNSLCRCNGTVVSAHQRIQKKFTASISALVDKRAVSFNAVNDSNTKNKNNGIHGQYFISWNKNCTNYTQRNNRRIQSNIYSKYPSFSSSTSSSVATNKFVLWDSLSQSMKEIPVSITTTTNTNTNDSTKTNNDVNKNISNKTTLTTTTTKALAWYTCGPTTYSSMHLGHARTYVWLDMMRRVLEFVATAQGATSPLFVMNITDIDDKILAAAAEAESEEFNQNKTKSKQSPIMLSRRSEANFWKDMDRLGCQRPHIVTRVTEFVDSDIVPYIERLVQQEMAYQSQDGVYFDVRAFEAKVGFYGKFGSGGGAGGDLNNDTSLQSSSKQQLASTTSSITPSSDTTENDMQQQASASKKDKRDFALWKLRKTGEDVYWPSPWGDGRPGWHIECSAMIEAVQQRFRDSHRFLVHAGGWDLKFPHHTNEIAQAEAYHYHGGCGCSGHSINDGDSPDEWIPHWVHTGHLLVKEKKMSKSLKNFLTVDELWFDYDASTSSQLDSPADDFRFWCLMGGTYAHREEYSRSKILGARQNREKILRFLLDGERWIDQCRKYQEESNQHANNSHVDNFSISSKNVYQKQWDDQHYQFFMTMNEALLDAYRSLLNNMRGTKYIENLLRIAETGSAHIRRNKPSVNTNVETVKKALQNTRDLLSLVGFSDSTVRVGLQTNNAEAETSTSTASNYVVGGETSLIEELVRFRASVRMAALDDVKNKKGTANMKKILQKCDEVRDTLPRIGLEIMDNKKQVDATWRFCVPKDKWKEK